MRSVRETYGLPERPPLPMREAIVMFVVPVLALVLWIVLPNSAFTVGLLAVTVLVAVFVGVGLVLRSRELDEEPGYDPMTPPSTRGPGEE